MARAWVMTIGSLLNAVGLCALAYSENHWAYFASWAFLGVSMRFTLYDGRLCRAGAGHRRRTGAGRFRFLTLWGGFASTVFWPIGHGLNEAVGWRETCLIFAVLNVLVCLPFALVGIGDPGTRGRRGSGREPATVHHHRRGSTTTSSAPSGPWQWYCFRSRRRPTRSSSARHRCISWRWIESSWRGGSDGP